MKHNLLKNAVLLSLATLLETGCGDVSGGNNFGLEADSPVEITANNANQEPLNLPGTPESEEAIAQAIIKQFPENSGIVTIDLLDGVTSEGEDLTGSDRTDAVIYKGFLNVSTDDYLIKSIDLPATEDINESTQDLIYMELGLHQEGPLKDLEREPLVFRPELNKLFIYTDYFADALDVSEEVDAKSGQDLTPQQVTYKLVYYIDNGYDFASMPDNGFIYDPEPNNNYDDDKVTVSPYMGVKRLIYVTITASGAVSHLEPINFSTETATELVKGSSFALELNAKPDDATVKDLIYQVESGSEFIQVDEDGLVTSIGEATTSDAIISITAPNTDEAAEPVVIRVPIKVVLPSARILDTSKNDLAELSIPTCSYNSVQALDAKGGYSYQWQLEESDGIIELLGDTTEKSVIFKAAPDLQAGSNTLSLTVTPGDGDETLPNATDTLTINTDNNLACNAAFNGWFDDVAGAQPWSSNANNKGTINKAELAIESGVGRFDSHALRWTSKLKNPVVTIADQSVIPDELVSDADSLWQASVWLKPVDTDKDPDSKGMDGAPLSGLTLKVNGKATTFTEAESVDGWQKIVYSDIKGLASGETEEPITFYLDNGSKRPDFYLDDFVITKVETEAEAE